MAIAQEREDKDVLVFEPTINHEAASVATGLKDT